jgi:hypothetical protein
MPHVAQLGSKVFVQTIKYPIKVSFKSLIEVGSTQEIEEPFRTGKSLVIRLPFKKALVIGIWRYALEESEALVSALGGRMMSIEEYHNAKEKESTEV